ncbi:MAG: radical SAM family heme chaperone HemW [Patescibacteria group bacterium]|mgnify:CR=1 FL=1
MKKDLSLYIHIPFCKMICLYCNFLTFANKSQWIPQYVDAVCKEIAERSQKLKNCRVVTINFGGGTPSLIEPLFIQKIIRHAKAFFEVEPDAEISIECNPESVDENRLKIYQEAGVTRFSLGVQSLNKKTLARVMRPHDSATIFKALSYIKNAGIKNFGTDFIMGLPGQTLVSFQQEVETILEYQPAHLSFYFLSYDTKKIDIFIKECPCEDEQIEMYEWLCQKLKAHGFTHYEVSNWAQPGFECKHNQRCWEQKDYLGIGVGAHSIASGTMWENQKSFDGYLKNPMKTCEEMPIDADLKRMEYIMLSLRTHRGMDLEWYKNFGDIKKLLQNAETYKKSGHLKKTANRLIATEKGFLILDQITQTLL